MSDTPDTPKYNLDRIPDSHETPKHGHDPIPMRQVPDMDALEEVGDFYWGETEGKEAGLLVFLIPSGRKGEATRIRLPVHDENEKATASQVAGRWKWDGNEGAPTLTPSVHTHGHWHGWVRGGKLVEA